MERYPITEKDRELIEIGLQVLANNFDDGIYNHTVGCTVLCKNGNVYKGVNCDGIHGSCAEYITIGICCTFGRTFNDKSIQAFEVTFSYSVPYCRGFNRTLLCWCT